MNTPSQDIIVNSSQYTPVYFIQGSNVNQMRPVLITQNSSPVEKPITNNLKTFEKPITNNLKTFYENSGLLESNLNAAENTTKPTILKKPECVVGNNLKLANFLKSEQKSRAFPRKIATLNNVVLKPVYLPNSTVPQLDMNSRIVQLKDLPNVTRAQNGRILPKMKPKENFNQMNNGHVKVLNKTIKISSPQNTITTKTKPVHNQATSNKLFYRVISPEGIQILERMKPETNKQNKQKKSLDSIVKTIEHEKTEETVEQKVQLEKTVTRSGRIVKLPKTMIVEDSPNKPKRRNGHVVSCLQCTSIVLTQKQPKLSVIISAASGRPLEVDPDVSD